MTLGRLRFVCADQICVAFTTSLFAAIETDGWFLETAVEVKAAFFIAKDKAGSAIGAFQHFSIRFAGG